MTERERRDFLSLLVEANVRATSLRIAHLRRITRWWFIVIASVLVLLVLNVLARTQPWAALGVWVAMVVVIATMTRLAFVLKRSADRVNAIMLYALSLEPARPTVEGNGHEPGA